MPIKQRDLYSKFLGDRGMNSLCQLKFIFPLSACISNLYVFLNLLFYVFPGLPCNIGFDTTGRYFLTAGDKHVHVLHNVTGYKATIEELIETEKKASGQAMKERVRQQIQDARWVTFCPSIMKTFPCNKQRFFLSFKNLKFSAEKF